VCVCGEATAGLPVALSPPQRNCGGSAISAWAIILSGGSPSISGCLLLRHQVSKEVSLFFVVVAKNGKMKGRYRGA
jgi:hypothetical protein